jgi:hypothetical protein
MGRATKAANKRFAGIRYRTVDIEAPERAVQAALIALVGTIERNIKTIKSSG